MGFWAAAMSTANYLRNRSPTTALEVTPYEAWYGTRPGLGHIRIFGCQAYAHVPLQIRSKTTWESHSTECLLFGYSDTENIYEVWDIKRGVSIRKRDVIFCENKLGSPILSNRAVQKGRMIFELEDDVITDIPALYAEQQSKDHPRPSLPTNQDTPVLDTFRRTTQQTVDKLPAIPQRQGIRFMEPIVQEVENPGKYTDITFAEPQLANIMTDNDQPEQLTQITSDDDPLISWDHLMFTALQQTSRMAPSRYWQNQNRIPHTYYEAMVSPDAQQWLLAMDIQLKKLSDAGTWELVFLLRGKRAIANKWVFSKKEGAKAAEATKAIGSNIVTELMHTARLVARGDLQSKGIDYDETFVLVVKLVSLRMLLTHAVRMDLDIQHWDIIAAFLSGDLDQEVYMQ